LLFRFFDECPRYESQIADNATAQTELTAFKATPTFQKTISSLRTALNLPADANITAKDVESAFSACAFDLALYGIRDAWCTLLSEDFIETNDYAEDLETFMEHGGGAKISYEISAVLLRDIYQDFTKFAGQQNGSLVGHLRFVHAETVLPLMTLLGYADKTPLSGTATASQIANRKFRSSRLSPFMANIEFRLYTKRSRSGTTKCRSLEEDDEGGEVKYYAQIRLNEQVTAVPGCDGKVFCSLSKLKKIWGYYLNDYNFAAECKV
jgi:multiple inositol-polyphosphate phosphatase / 2,3-bisphosphoglycerate 3-phosphatase